MLKLVIFDCDGVMFDSREANRAYYNHLLETFGCPPMDEDEVDYVHIHNVNDSVDHIFRHHRVDRAAVDRYRERLDYSRFLHHMKMEPDLKEFLDLIRPRLHTAISTNRTTTMEIILDIFDLASRFEMVVTALSAPRPKPAPDGLLMILDHFRVRPEEAIYIGDSIIDQHHCAGTGVDLIGFRNPELAARYHVDSFLAMTDLPPFREVLAP